MSALRGIRLSSESMRLAVLRVIGLRSVVVVRNQFRMIMFVVPIVSRSILKDMIIGLKKVKNVCHVIMLYDSKTHLFYIWTQAIHGCLYPYDARDM